jgi:hypothetical protein
MSDYLFVFMFDYYDCFFFFWYFCLFFFCLFFLICIIRISFFFFFALFICFAYSCFIFGVFSLPPLFRTDYPFEAMGIGGLDREFSTIFRRAFASRCFPAAMIKKLGLPHVKVCVCIYICFCIYVC